MEHLHAIEILPHHSHFLRRRLRHLHTVLCGLVWKANLHQTQYYLPDASRVAVLYCPLDAILNSVPLLVWHWSGCRLPPLKKIHLWDYTRIKQIDTINKVKDILCDWLSVRLPRCMVFAIKPSLAMAPLHYLPSKHLRFVRDRPKWEIKPKIPLVQQQIRRGLRINPLHDKTQRQIRNPQIGSGLFDGF